MQSAIPLTLVLLAVCLLLTGCNPGAANKSRAQLAMARQELAQAHAELEAQKEQLETNELKLQELREIQIQLPPASEATAITPPIPLVVDISQDGKLEFEGQPATEEQLQEFLYEAVEKNTDQPIIIRGAGQTPLEQVASVMSMCQRVGIDNYSVAVATEE